MASNYTAFLGTRCIAAGPLHEVARIAAGVMREHNGAEALLVFEDDTGFPTELDLREAAPAPTPAPSPPAPARRGRPQLGVVAREVTLLPRHWEWLGLQPGGASVALRKLVEEARRTHGAQDLVRAAQERTYRFLGPIAGHLPGYEEALRALFGGKREAFDGLTAGWPGDIYNYTKKLSHDAFTGN